jgi:DNA-binding NarL/FixJ family response regulator
MSRRVLGRMAIHRLNSTELTERNRKILGMVERGCDYGDIGNRYGIKRESVSSIVKRAGFSKWVNAQRWDGARYVDGIQ